jgi:hypothetical protein
MGYPIWYPISKEIHAALDVTWIQFTCWIGSPGKPTAWWLRINPYHTRAVPQGVFGYIGWENGLEK